MLKPVNNHLLIEPLVQESFISSGRDTYQEIGIVIAVDDALLGAVMIGTSISENYLTDAPPVKVGDKVYFDSWMAAKFPKDGDSFYWLVEWSSVRAVEHVVQE